MGRTTVYNSLVTSEKWKLVNAENVELMNDFIDYLSSVDRSEQTIYQYTNDLKIFFVWNLDENNNKPFISIRKRDFVRFQKTVLDDYKWSPARIKRVKSVLSSLSTYIENFLDDEYPDFRSVVNKVESPSNEKVREKSVISNEKVELLLDTLTEEKRYEQACAIAILANSGMRKGELLQMKAEYFDDDHIGYNGAMYITDKIRTKGRGRKGKQLSKYILIGAKPYIDRWLEERERLGIDNDYLFVSYTNGKWEQRSSLDHWSEYFSEIIDMPFYFHALRHYLTTRLINEYNIPSEVVREFNGWNDVSLISIYNDSDARDSFGKYFTSEGIIKQEEGTFDK